MTIYGQVVVGPPGCGKTTYCQGMQEYLRLLGRNAWVINLDPANEVPASLPSRSPRSRSHDDDHQQDESDSDDDQHTTLPYDALLDVCESVVNLSSVMKKLGLGPNGGLIYCMEYLEAHADEVVDVLTQRIREKGDEDNNSVYLLIDLPGQVELYTHGTAVPRLLHKLIKAIDLRLVAVQLIDAHYCTEPSNFLSATLLATNIMLRLELPAVCVLSKVDLLVNYGPLPFNLEFFTECQDLERLVPYLTQQHIGDSTDDDDGIDDELDISGDGLGVHETTFADDPEYQKARRITRSSPFFRKHERLHQRIAETVEDFSLLSFLPLDIQDAESVGRVVARIDKANGYVFVASSKQNKTSNNNSRKTTMTPTTEDLFQCAIQSETSMYESIADVQERIVTAREHHQMEKRQGGKK
jgi:GTPase SAR1 family protein